jgi:hypothetical protein
MALRVSGWTAAGVLLASAAYELALGASSVGSAPGDGAPGAGVVSAAALVLLLTFGTTALAGDGH